MNYFIAVCLLAFIFLVYTVYITIGSVDSFLNGGDCEETSTKTCAVSHIDNQVYSVLKTENKDEAANNLAILNKLNQEVIDAMSEQNFAPGTDEYERRERLINNYRPDRLFEHRGSGPQDSSFTINKGEEISMCMRDPKTGDLQDLEMIKYVNLHELAHVASEGYGHDEDFWDSFKFILKEANQNALYEPVNYKEKPEEYCGMLVDFNPFFETDFSKAIA